MTLARHERRLGGGTLQDDLARRRRAPWRDALHEGPLGTREARARSSPRAASAAYQALLSDLVARDDALGGARDVVLWFEHDLYDQLQLVEILARRPPQAELIQAAVFLGELVPGARGALADAGGR